MMIKITGLDELQKQLKEAEDVLSQLDGELGTVQFNPGDPASIDAAIQSVESMIDARLGLYASNPVIAPLAEQMKEKYRDAIVERAAAARIEGGADVE
jgi:hypothetical protein